MTVKLSSGDFVFIQPFERTDGSGYCCFWVDLDKGFTNEDAQEASAQEVAAFFRDGLVSECLAGLEEVIADVGKGKPCECCGKPFRGNAKARTCSDACRVRMHRAKQKAGPVADRGKSMDIVYRKSWLRVEMIRTAAGFVAYMEGHEYLGNEGWETWFTQPEKTRRLALAAAHSDICTRLLPIAGNMSDPFRRGARITLERAFSEYLNMHQDEHTGPA